MTVISHILYDLGNTLLYLDAPWPQVFADGLAGFEAEAAKVDIAIDPSVLSSMFRQNLEIYYSQRERDLIEHTSVQILADTFASLNQTHVAEETLLRLLSAFYRQTQQHWQPNDFAVEMLAGFKQSGYHQAVLSNAAHDADVQDLVDKSEFRPHLDFVLSSAAIGFRKPHPIAFRTALHRWNTTPDTVIMIGDTRSADILGAMNSGIRCVWTKQYVLELPRSASQNIPADFEIESLQELPELLKTIG